MATGVYIGAMSDPVEGAWTQGTIGSVTNWSCVAYGDGKYVAMNRSNAMFAYSTDGINWTTKSTSSSYTWNSVAYGNGKFVAVNGGGSAGYIVNDTLTMTTMPNTYTWISVAYGNGKFVAIASNSTTVAYSTDGITWSSSTLPSGSSWKSITYGDGKFVAITASSTTAAYSTDGINWTITTLPSGVTTWKDVTFGNGKFVAIASGSKISAYSTDGITWSAGTVPTNAYNYSAVCYGNNKFLAVANDSSSGDKPMYSTDGITWTLEDNAVVCGFYDICYGADKFVAVGYYDQQSYYKTVSPAQPNIARKVNSLYVGVNNIARKITKAYIGDSSGIARLCYQYKEPWNPVIVAVGHVNLTPYAATSTDGGATWTRKSLSPMASPASVICYGNGTFVVASYRQNDADNYYHMTSTDGLTWTHTSSSRRMIGDMVFGNGTFVCVACDYYNGYMYIGTSSNGKSWTWGNRDLPSNFTPDAVRLTFSPSTNLFTLIDSSKGTYTSADGLTWTKSSTSTTRPAIVDIVSYENVIADWTYYAPFSSASGQALKVSTDSGSTYTTSYPITQSASTKGALVDVALNIDGGGKY